MVNADEWTEGEPLSDVEAFLTTITYKRDEEGNDFETIDLVSREKSTQGPIYVLVHPYCNRLDTVVYFEPRSSCPLACQRCVHPLLLFGVVWIVSLNITFEYVTNNGVLVSLVVSALPILLGLLFCKEDDKSALFGFWFLRQTDFEQTNERSLELEDIENLH